MKKFSRIALWLSISLCSAQLFAQLPEFTGLVEKAAPAVVNITANRKRPENTPQFNDQQVPEFFRRFMPQQRIPRSATGSGFIISSDGYILTNNHVVADADEIIVALSDRRERVAQLVGTDELSDLALLKIDEKGLPEVEIGNSSKLQVGEWVIAMGSPFGFEHSVTAGIVSAKGRSLPEEQGNYVPYIQTDVAINPGNSGGPLFNLDGEVVGINSQIYSRSGGYMGLSFAIPIDVAMEVVAQLKDKGSVSRGWLGVQIQRVDRDLAESFGLDRPSGALVTQVFSDSPAEQAGVREGDIILEFSGHAIDLSSDLPHFVGRTKAETLAKMVVVRNGERKTLKVKIGTLENNATGDSTTGPVIQTGNRLGIKVQDMTDQDKNRLSVKEGVIVKGVSNGPGRKAAIQSGDVITTIDGQAITGRDQFEKIVEALPTNVAIPVRVVRNQQAEFLVVKILP